MYTRIASYACIVLFSGAALAAPESYTVDPTHTFPSFEISHLGFSTQRGRFNSTKGRVVLDLKARTASVEITIDAASIDTGLDKLETHLRNPDFFDVEKYPTLSFTSTGARFNGDKLIALTGDLTIRGQTKPVTFTVTAFKCGMHPVAKKQACGAEATTTIKRSDFGMTYGLPAVGDAVKLLLQIEAHKD